ncbi:MAG TPA: alpha/beta hydrolase [Nannocystis exedens]|nr:alpha/beta hydrolase [Nannocystis exedens]
MQSAMTSFQEFRNGEINLRVAVAGEGPLILFVHGWPELWYSWRHQLAYFAAAGYRVAALDLRGYGGSSKPHAIEAYTLKKLTSDVLTVARALSDSPVILVGHDWGAPIVYTTALLASDEVRAVAGLSVPFVPPSETMTLDIFRRIYAGRFFYQLYFQKEGPIEAELEADVAAALRKIYLSASGDAAATIFADKAADARFLDGMPDPTSLPAWLNAEDVEVFAAAFRKGGFRGPINRYRAQAQDHSDLSSLRGSHLTMPTCFIGGERDPVRSFVPGFDLFATPIVQAACDDFRGATILPRIGHWVQQEAPEETNAALAAFFASL